MLAVYTIGPGYNTMQGPPALPQLVGCTNCFGDDAAASSPPPKKKSIAPGVLSLLAGTLLVGGMLYGIKHF